MGWREQLKAVWKWLRCWLDGTPHFVVGANSPGGPYLLRWYIIPRNDWLNVYLHKFLRDDDDRALHDHPWRSWSLLLAGRYVEERPGGVRTEYRAGSFLCREAGYPHRIELPGGKPAWTLFVTGRRVREWGFLCPQGWVHWKKFTASGRPGEVGPGCDQP